MHFSSTGSAYVWLQAVYSNREYSGIAMISSPAFPALGHRVSNESMDAGTITGCFQGKSTAIDESQPDILGKGGKVEGSKGRNVEVV